MLQIGDNLNENGQCANFRWGQCYRGKSRGGEVRLCTQWSNGNISESKGQLFGRDPPSTIFQFSFADKSSSRHLRPCHCLLLPQPRKTLLKTTIHWQLIYQPLVGLYRTFSTPHNIYIVFFGVVFKDFKKLSCIWVNASPWQLFACSVIMASTNI